MMPTRQLLHGLSYEESSVAVWKLLFSPALRTKFGRDWSFHWTQGLVDNLTAGDQIAFSNQYNGLADYVQAALAEQPRYSMENPPWSMLSLDLRIGLVPWVTPLFDQFLLRLLSAGSALEKHFGEVLPLAFFLLGGPGDSKETAFRVCAPSQGVRAFSEHWLMRGYLWRREQGFHATLGPDDRGRKFSMHSYIDRDGTKKEIYFETTDSFGREEEDFLEFLRKDWPGVPHS